MIVDKYDYIQINQKNFKVKLKEKVHGTNEAMVYILSHSSDEELKSIIVDAINTCGCVYWENEDVNEDDVGKKADIDITGIPKDVCLKFIAIAEKMKKEAPKNQIDRKQALADSFLNRLKKY